MNPVLTAPSGRRWLTPWRSVKREIAELASVIDGAAAVYDEAGAKLVRDGGFDAVMGEFAQMRLRFADELSAHPAEQSKVLSTFNVAFFGRTGAGKSTLLSAFGELNGEAVSPGASDWTETVKSPSGGAAASFTTPGINGWGRRKVARSWRQLRAKRSRPPMLCCCASTLRVSRRASSRKSLRG